MVMLKVENLSKKFKDLEVLKDISLEVNQVKWLPLSALPVRENPHCCVA